MDKFHRTWVLAAIALGVPMIPLLFWGEQLEASIESLLSEGLPRWSAFGLVVTVLAADIFLPVPSSFVSTVAGMQLGIPLGTLASWLGMSLGAFAGYGIARAWGRPLALRLSRADDLAQLDQLAERFGPRILVLFRAVPVLAEASVLLFGSTRLSWARFLAPVALANLGIAAAYSVLGYYGRTQHMTLYVLAASIALPIAATTIIRWGLPAAGPPTAGPTTESASKVPPRA